MTDAKSSAGAAHPLDTPQEPTMELSAKLRERAYCGHERICSGAVEGVLQWLPAELVPDAFSELCAGCRDRLADLTWAAELGKRAASPPLDTGEAPTEPPLLAALKAARDLLVGCQKHAGQIPGQGYAATLTEHEMVLARGIESVDAIISQAEREAIVVADIRQGLRRWVQSNKYSRAEDAKAEGK